MKSNEQHFVTAYAAVNRAADRLNGRPVGDLAEWTVEELKALELLLREGKCAVRELLNRKIGLKPPKEGN